MVITMKPIPEIPRGRWTQGEIARDKLGKPTNSGNPNAFKWCLVGWIIKFNSENAERNKGIHDAITSVIRTKTCGVFRNIDGWNDYPGRTLKEVNEVIRAANSQLKTIKE